MLMGRLERPPMRAELLSVFLEPPEAGWMNLTISADSQTVVIHTSDVFDPYPEIVQWLRSVKAGRLPSIVEIDEEGRIKVLAADFTGKGLIRFTAADYDYGEGFEDEPEYPRVYIDVEIDGARFLQEFCSALFRALNADFLRKGWTGKTEFDMEELRQYFVLRQPQ